MEQQKQVETFARKLAGLGYAGEFNSYDGDRGKLETVLAQFLHKNKASIAEAGNAITTIGTVTDGTPKKTASTVASFLVDYERKNGFSAGHLVVFRVDENQQTVKNRTYHFSGKQEIPCIDSVNRDVLAAPRQNNQRLKQHRWPR